MGKIKTWFAGVALAAVVSATSLAAGIDGSFYRVVPILAGGDLADIIFHAPETRREREKLVARGIDQEKLEPVMGPVPAFGAHTEAIRAEFGTDSR